MNCRLIASKLIHEVTAFIMGLTALSCALIATVLTMLADPVISSPQEYIPPDPEPAAVFNSGKAVKREALQQLRDYVKHEDSLLHDLRKDSFSTLRELVKEGDGNVQDRLLLGLAQSKGRDDQLKEELDEDVAWLKDQLTKGQRRLNEELAEEEARRKEELTEQKENLDNLRSSVKQWTEPCSAVTDDLKKQMTDFQIELKGTKEHLQTTQTELETSQRNLQTMQEIVRSNQESVQSSQFQEELQKIREQLRNQEQAFTAVQTQLQDEVRSLKVEVHNLQSSYALLNTSELENCPLTEGYAVHASHCIKLYSTAVDYQTARDTCQNDGGHLYHYKSRECDMPPIAKLYPNSGIPRLWVGADRLSTAFFTWSDGTPLYDNATVWSKNEPNNEENRGEECVHLWPGYTLNDLMCTRKNAFVCQIDLLFDNSRCEED